VKHFSCDRKFVPLLQAEKAAEDCKKALDLEKDNVKALFRRAQARKVTCCFLRLLGYHQIQKYVG
jgi:hypothetical protein